MLCNQGDDCTKDHEELAELVFLIGPTEQPVLTSVEAPLRIPMGLLVGAYDNKVSEVSHDLCNPSRGIFACQHLELNAITGNNGARILLPTEKNNGSILKPLEMFRWIAEQRVLIRQECKHPALAPGRN